MLGVEVGVVVPPGGGGDIGADARHVVTRVMTRCIFTAVKASRSSGFEEASRGCLKQAGGLPARRGGSGGPLCVCTCAHQELVVIGHCTPSSHRLMVYHATPPHPPRYSPLTPRSTGARSPKCYMTDPSAPSLPLVIMLHHHIPIQTDTHNSSFPCRIITINRS
jgi:hypothetical protein